MTGCCPNTPLYWRDCNEKLQCFKACKKNCFTHQFTPKTRPVFGVYLMSDLCRRNGGGREIEMELCIKNALVHRADGSFSPGEVYVRGERLAPPFDASEVLDAHGALLCPGLFDIHTHGRCGGDFCNAEPAKLAEMAQDFARHGVTALLPTLASDTPEHWRAALARLGACGIPAFAGVHLEGRWLSSAKRGAHAKALLSAPEPAELLALAKASPLPLRKVTFAPELDDGRFLAACKKVGAKASIGHTSADFAIASAALAAGVDSFTHLFNAMPPLHHRAGGPVAAALTSEAFVELICDGLHVAPEVVALLKAAKGTRRTILVSDSMSGTGCPDGTYSIAGQTAFLQNGVARTADGALAGSTLELLQGVQKLAAFWRIPFGKALLSATRTPAESLGLAADHGTLAPGAFANLFLLEKETDPRPARVLWFGRWI